jgi:hypothetical protein
MIAEILNYKQMNKIFLIIFIFLINVNVNSQTKERKLKAISIIESLRYEEIFLEETFIASVKINFDEQTKRIEIINTYENPLKLKNITKTIFLLEDLDLSTLSIDIREITPGLFSPLITVNAKGSVIKQIIINKKKYFSQVSETNYLKVLEIFPGTKILPKELAENILKM